MITPRLVNHKANTPALLLTREMFVSARCMKKPGGCTASDSVSRVSHVSVKQRTLQSLMSLWKATLARISSTLLSRDWTLASSILGSGGRCACLRSLTRRPRASLVRLFLLTLSACNLSSSPLDIRSNCCRDLHGNRMILVGC